MRIPLTYALAAASLAATLGGCGNMMASQYSEPYAVLDAEHRMTMKGVQPALVVSVDGKSVAGQRKHSIKPGTHQVEVSISGLSAGNNKTITLDAEPCIHYFLGGKLAANGEWTASVVTTETIGECRK